MGNLSLRRLVVIPIRACWGGAAQNAPQPSAADRELEEVLMKWSPAAAPGDHATAINLMESALQKVQKDPALKDRETDLLSRLGKARMDGGRPAAAMARRR
jgi:hypothetical protein